MFLHTFQYFLPEAYHKRSQEGIFILNALKFRRLLISWPHKYTFPTENLSRGKKLFRRSNTTILVTNIVIPRCPTLSWVLRDTQKHLRKNILALRNINGWEINIKFKPKSTEYVGHKKFLKRDFVMHSLLRSDTLRKPKISYQIV